MTETISYTGYSPSTTFGLTLLICHSYSESKYPSGYYEFPVQTYRINTITDPTV